MKTIDALYENWNVSKALDALQFFIYSMHRTKQYNPYNQYNPYLSHNPHIPHNLQNPYNSFNQHTLQT